MFHKNVSDPQPNVFPSTDNASPAARLTLVPTPAATPRRSPDLTPTSSLIDLAVIAARRGASFFAEAAVLVLVFGILDFFILKGRIDLNWIVGALAISLGLLAASIAMDFSAHRWIKAHP